MSSESLLKESSIPLQERDMGEAKNHGQQVDGHIAIRVQNLSKCYQLYDRPEDRLKQAIYPRMRRLMGMEPKDYARKFWALKDISFDIRKGEAFGIVGRNGSGKSTLLQLICGTLAPTSGEVQANGRIGALLELGSGFNPEFTGRENVYMSAAILGLNKNEVNERFDDIAAFADIGEFIEQPVKTYSSGMMVRLAFAVQVQIEPDILIVDEALAVGDALFQKRCYERIEKLVSNGVTLLFVSHDQEAVRTLTHRSLLLHQGKSVMCSLSAEVMLAYRKLLHDAESAYFSSITTRLKESAQRAADDINCEASSVQEKLPGRAGKMSFGGGGVKIVDVQVLDPNGNPCAVFYPGDRLRVKVECLSEIETDKLNVAVRIRNKEGLKVYSWGTLNQDIQVVAGLKKGQVFWRRQIHAGERFAVWLECDCSLGSNLYEIQAAVSYEDTLNYSAQRILHWVDEASFFQVALRQQEYFFGGITDLRMKASW